jgi:hypothetical protein
VNVGWVEVRNPPFHLMKINGGFRVRSTQPTLTTPPTLTTRIVYKKGLDRGDEGLDRGDARF